MILPVVLCGSIKAKRSTTTVEMLTVCNIFLSVNLFLLSAYIASASVEESVNSFYVENDVEDALNRVCGVVLRRVELNGYYDSSSSCSVSSIVRIRCLCKILYLRAPVSGNEEDFVVVIGIHAVFNGVVDSNRLNAYLSIVITRVCYNEGKGCAVAGEIKALYGEGSLRRVVGSNARSSYAPRSRLCSTYDHSYHLR